MKITDLSIKVSRDLVARLVCEGRVRRDGEVISLSPAQRLNLAIEAIKSGMDVVPVSRNLSWKEFEWLACEAFAANHFQVLSNLRFSHDRSRFEIDLFALSGPVGLVVDCKRWKRSTRSSLINAGARQLRRTQSLAMAIGAGQVSLGISGGISLIPVTLTLADVPQRVACNALVVPILRLKSFLTEFSTPVELLILSRNMGLDIIQARPPRQCVLDPCGPRNKETESMRGGND